MEASPQAARAVPAPASLGIDCLPSEILDKIVRCLPLRDAVRTSALSRSWRRRWESVPGLRFCWWSDDAPLAAVGAVLTRYACPIVEFCHFWVVQEGFDHTVEWLRLLARKGVKSLTLHLTEAIDVGFHTIHTAIFSCHELTDLSLGGCYLPSAPSCFTGFPNLTSLSLYWVGLPEHGEKDLEAMISSAPSLRSLDLDNVWIDSDDFDDWVIRAPNL